MVAGDDAPGLHDRLGALVVGQRRHPGRPAEALLEAGDADVHVPGVGLDLAAAQAEHGVHDQQRVVLAAGRADLGQRLHDPGRGVGVDDRDQFGRPRAQPR